MQIKIIIIFLAMGLFVSPAFAQFGGIEHDIRGGEILGFEIDEETNSVVIPIDARSRGELTITLPRSLIDAKINSEDTDFKILVSGLNLNFYDETSTPTDRTVIIPFSRSDYEIIITGTHLFSQENSQAKPQTKSQQMEKAIQDELASELPENQAKLLVFSDTQWSGALQSSSFPFTEIDGNGDYDIIFNCESSIGNNGIFGAKVQKTTQEGFVTVVVIQNQEILYQVTTQEEFGDILINGNCASDFADNGGGCLIATATYGSELAPQVQQLRELRDNKLLQTESGIAFMTTFNEFYYSFSPTIADLEREYPVFKESVKLALTPMISSLSVLNYVGMNSEITVLGYGTLLILLNIGIYIGIPMGMIYTIQRTRIHFGTKDSQDL